MSDVDRRDFIAATAVAAAGITAALASAKTAQAGDPSFMNNVPDPLLSGKELPTFKFELEKSKARVLGKNTAREASVTQLPISKGLAGVSMGLEPGAMRELHWHATAAEWAYVDKGRVRTTVISPDGTWETNDFDTGDVWYFPRGHAHMLETLGDEPCHFILIFDNGYFSEFGTFSISDWIGHVPKELLAKNFGLPASTFDSFPKTEVYFAVGSQPPPRPAEPLAGLKPPALTHRYRLMASDPVVSTKGGTLRLVDVTKFPIATTMAGGIFEFQPGGLRELHWHPTADEWQYVLSGKIGVTLFGANGRFRTEVLNTGDVGYIPQGYGHSLENIGPDVAKVLVGFNAGQYQDIDLTAWIASNPPDVLATNFSQPATLFEKFPCKDLFIAGGK